MAAAWRHPLRTGLFAAVLVWNALFVLAAVFQIALQHDSQATHEVLTVLFNLALLGDAFFAMAAVFVCPWRGSHRRPAMQEPGLDQ